MGTCRAHSSPTPGSPTLGPLGTVGKLCCGRPQGATQARRCKECGGAGGECLVAGVVLGALPAVIAALCWVGATGLGPDL